MAWHTGSIAESIAPTMKPIDDKTVATPTFFSATAPISTTGMPRSRRRRRDRLGGEHLAGIGLRRDARREVDGGAEHVAVPLDGRPVVEAGAQRGQRLVVGGGGEQAFDQLQRVARRRRRHEDRVADAS